MYHTNDKLRRDADRDIVVGHTYNSKQIEDIIMSDRWPTAGCEVCGGRHPAAIRKAMDTQHGAEFEFIAPECPNPPAATGGE